MSQIYPKKTKQIPIFLLEKRNTDLQTQLLIFIFIFLQFSDATSLTSIPRAI